MFKHALACDFSKDGIGKQAYMDFALRLCCVSAASKRCPLWWAQQITAKSRPLHTIIALIVAYQRRHPVDHHESQLRLLFCFLSRLQLTATLNPGCREFCENNTAITLVHIAATSDTDTIHYVWDFTGKPTILVALTSKQAEFHIDWPRLMESKTGSVRFTEAPQYTFMAIINRVGMHLAPSGGRSRMQLVAKALSCVSQIRAYRI